MKACLVCGHSQAFAEDNCCRGCGAIWRPITWAEMERLYDTSGVKEDVPRPDDKVESPPCKRPG